MERITSVANMEDGTTKTNQNGILKIAEDKAAKVLMAAKLRYCERCQKREQLKTEVEDQC